MSDYELGDLIAEGKTKRVFGLKRWQGITTNLGDLAVIESKDDITAGDGAKHEIMPGKGELSTATTSNVFHLLEECGLPLAWKQRIDATRFLTSRCQMLELEVVARREAHGSYLKRHPYVLKEHVFPRLLVEFYLKTKDQRWREHELPQNDPLMVIRDGRTHLYRPDQPLHGSQPFLVLDQFPSSDNLDRYAEMEPIARRAFLILEKAWQLHGRRLVDCKIEFGLDRLGHLLLADVIDADSWRVVFNGQYEDKQLFRDGVEVSEVERKFRLTADLTARFCLPRQRVILWRASDKDDLTLLHEMLKPFLADDCQVAEVTCSAHKEPVRTALTVQRMVQEIPDCVIIAYVGKSNGLGPTLAGTTTVPVISVPASLKEFRHDVWSSLRTPSVVPALTVLEPANAVLAALQILAPRNPRLYALLRLQLEVRLTNIIELG